MTNYQGPGTYRHYKGNQYEVLGLALQEDSLDKENDPQGGKTFVIYRPLMAGGLLPARNRGEKFWARELSDFNDTMLDGTPRFERIAGS